MDNSIICVNVESICDKIPDCPKNDDEDFCDPPIPLCPSGCHCRNGAHLQYCTLFQCSASFKCPDSYCIPFKRVCDGTSDCQDAEDELSCEHHACQGIFKCTNPTFCISHLSVCDGIKDCLHGDNEENCERFQCLEGCDCLNKAIFCHENSTHNSATNQYGAASTDDGFTLPRDQRRRLYRDINRNKPKVVIGKDRSSGLKGPRSTPHTSVFVYGTQKGTTEDDVTRHMENKNVKPFQVERKSGSWQRFDSFCVTINKEDWDSVMHSDFWPNGVRCRYFHPPKVSSQNRGSPHSSITPSEVDTLAEHLDMSHNADDDWHKGSYLFNSRQNGNVSFAEDWDKQD